MGTATSLLAPERAVPTSRPDTGAAPPSGAHVPALDGVRGLAILLVLVYHLTMGISAGDVASRWLLKLAGAGWCGVDLFFVLSGFLITGILCDTKGDPHRVRNFYARRALRIVPLYYATLGLAFAARAAVPAWVPDLAGVEDAGPWLAGYGTNILAALRGGWFPLGHFWSLAVEEHFYLVWPAVVFGLSRRGSMRVCGLVVLMALVVRALLVRADAVLAAYCLTACRSDALALGGLVALASRGPGGLEALRPAARRGIVLVLPALGALAAWRVGLRLTDPAIQTVGYLLLDLLFACGIVLVVASPDASALPRLFTAKPLRILGRYSYGLYVFNSIAILVLDGMAVVPRVAGWSGSASLARLVYSALVLASTGVAAWLSFHALERPLLGLKAFFPREATGPAGVPGRMRPGTLRRRIAFAVARARLGRRTATRRGEPLANLARP